VLNKAKTLLPFYILQLFTEQAAVAMLGFHSGGNHDVTAIPTLFSSFSACYTDISRGLIQQF
jgi:hypothetical protein